MCFGTSVGTLVEACKTLGPAGPSSVCMRMYMYTFSARERANARTRACAHACHCEIADARARACSWWRVCACTCSCCVQQNALAQIWAVTVCVLLYEDIVKDVSRFLELAAAVALVADAPVPVPKQCAHGCMQVEIRDL